MIQRAIRKIIRTLAVLLITTLPATARAQQSQPDTPVQAAVRQFEAKQYQEAQAAFEKLFNADEKNATAAFYLGRIAFQQNKADEAVRWFEVAVRLEDSNSGYHHWLGQAFGKKARSASLVSRAGLAKKVREELLKAVELDPDNLAARADLARYYNEVPAFLGGSEERAQEQAAVIKKKDALKGWLLAGELLADKKKNPEAERAYLEAEKVQTDKFEATFKLGFFYQQTRDFDKALAAYDRILKSQPDNRAALFQIGRTAGMSGKILERGLAAFEAVRPTLRDTDRDALIGLYWWRGKIYEAAGERDKARADYEALDRISPGHPETRAALERVRLKTSETTSSKTVRQPGLLSLAPSSFQSFDGETLDCEAGRVLVPENRRNKSSRLLELAFIRFKSAAKEPQSPVIYVAGGPGGSGIVSARVTEFFQTIKAIRQFADVIVYDQRGTGASTPDLTCPGTFGDLPSTALRSREDLLHAFTEIAQKCADKVRAQGADFDGYTILESADDIEDIRRALGLRKVSLWGYSYGTQLAFATLRRHESSIDRLILMGVEGVSNTEKLPSDVDQYFEQLAAMCKNDPRIGAGVPDLTGLMRSVFAKLDREPVTVSVTSPATGMKREMVVGGFGLRVLALQTILNNTRNLPVIPLLFSSLARGDRTVLAEMLGAVQGRGMLSADWFLIDGASGATAERRAQIRREARVALLGDVINFPLPDINAVWQPKDLGDEFRKPVKSKAPALFISGTLDANTPPHRTEEVRQGFPNAAHLIIENAGHQDLLRGPGIIEAVAAFVQGKKVESKKFALPAPEFIPMTAGK